MLYRIHFSILQYNEDTSNNTTVPPFYQPGIVLTFDDVFVDEWYDADQTMASYNWKATFFITKYDQYTEGQILKLHILEGKGHEIGGHGLHHLKASDYISSYGMPAYFNDEILPMIQLMQTDGFDLKTFAYPYGDRNAGIDHELLGYFKILRGTTYGRMNPAHQNCFFTGSSVVYGLGIDESYGNDIEYLKNLMQFAKEHNKIVIFYGHQIVTQATANYQTPLDKLEKICQFANENGLKFYKADELTNL